MATKTECDKCGNALDSKQHGTTSVSILSSTVVQGKVESGRGTYVEYALCPTCVDIVHTRLSGVLNEI